MIPSLEDRLLKSTKNNRVEKSIDLHFSIIVPVYNRPDEVEELLASMTKQTRQGFEVVIVEDGSVEKCEHIVNKYSSQLNLKYYFKENSGPGPSRNYGFERASGNYCIFLDSDCILPPQWFEVITSRLSESYTDAFGGPDAAHPDFSPLQKAINYSMTSFFTTGGIRGGSEKVDKFYPRSFNMGYSREVFEKTGGFARMRFGEDIDMSIRILENGFQTRLFKDASVFHKRRTHLRQFFKQVYNSGIARINLYKKHPQSLKAVHFAPAIFTVGVVTLILGAVFYTWMLLMPLLLHLFLILADSIFRTKSISVGLLSIVTSYLQLTGYGSGFIGAFFRRILLGKGEFSAFGKNFYK